MNPLISALAAFATGAAAMYYLDPDLGRRRRALARDKAVKVSHQTRDYAQIKGKQAVGHLKGLALGSRTRIDGWVSPPSDDRLGERVRAHLGRAVTHPGAIDVGVQGGRAQLTGHVLAHEVNRLIGAVKSTPGVHGVDNMLSVHADAVGVPELQGEGRRHRSNGAARHPLLPWLAVAVVVGSRMAKRSREPHEAMTV
jgi:hypothetical protein